MKFIDLSSQYQAYKKEILAEINDVLDNSAYIMGKALTELEKGLGKFTGAKHAIGCSSGTDALLLGLLAIDLKAGDEVIVPAFSFFATAEVVSLIGGVPIFVDIEEDTFNLDVSQIEAHITSKTKAIMPVSLYGQVADMAKINDIAKRHQLKVIEDAAQSFGATYRGRPSGNLSEIGCTSFFPAKPLGAYGDSGAVFTNDDDLAEKIRMLLNHGSKKRYVHELIGINARLDNLQAAILKVKLKYFPEEIKKRQHLAVRYGDLIKNDKIKTPIIKKENTSVYAQYSIRIKNRDQAILNLEEKKIPVAVHYPAPLYQQPVYKNLNINPKHYPTSELISKEILSLPMSPFLTENDQDQVIAALNSI